MAKKASPQNPEPEIKLYSLTGRPDHWVRDFDATWPRGAGQPDRILRGVVAAIRGEGATPTLAVYTDRIERTQGSCTEYPGPTEVELKDDDLMTKLVLDSLAQVAAQRPK